MAGRRTRTQPTRLLCSFIASRHAGPVSSSQLWRKVVEAIFLPLGYSQDPAVHTSRAQKALRHSFDAMAAELSLRVERLEGIVGTARGGDECGVGAGLEVEPRKPLTERVAALSVRLADAGCVAPRVVALAAREDDHTDSPATHAVLAASAKTLAQTAQQLETVHNLSSVTDSEFIPEVAAQRADMDRIAPLILSQAAAVSDLGRQLESFLQSYNDAAVSMSETVLQLDARIKRLEQRQSEPART